MNHGPRSAASTFFNSLLVQIKEYERGWVCAVAADAISVRNLWSNLDGAHAAAQRSDRLASTIPDQLDPRAINAGRASRAILLKPPNTPWRSWGPQSWYMRSICRCT